MLLYNNIIFNILIFYILLLNKCYIHSKAIYDDLRFFKPITTVL
jgi:hypothetical protein